MDTLVFVLCLNHSAITKVCIDSVLATVPSGTEVLVFDNGSTDNTPEMLNSFGDKITVIRAVKNLGTSKAVNQGKDLANGRLFVKMANDHIMTPGWLEKLFVMQDNRPGIYSPITVDNTVVPSIKRVAARRKELNVKYFNEQVANRQRIKQYMKALYPQGLEHFAKIAQHEIDIHKPRLNGVWPGVQCIHPDVIDTVGYMDERFGMHFGADTDYVFRARANKFLVAGSNHFVHHFGSFTIRKQCSGWNDISKQDYAADLMKEGREGHEFLKKKHETAKSGWNEYSHNGKLHRNKIEDHRAWKKDLWTTDLDND